MSERVVKSLISSFNVLAFSAFAVTSLPAQQVKPPAPLRTKSPFEPGKTLPKAEPKKAPFIQKTTTSTPPNNDIELRGYMQWNGVWYFSIYDRSNRESHFITKGKGESGFEVVEWEEFSHKLKLSNHGKLMILGLKEPAYKPSPQSKIPLPKPSKKKGK